MKLADEDSEDDLHLVPGSHGMNVPSACTIVIIAGFQIHTHSHNVTFPNPGKYITKVDRVMTLVDRITEDIDHMPVAAFIFRDKESDTVHYSSDKRLFFKIFLYWK